jgi:hypothetical protein
VGAPHIAGRHIYWWSTRLFLLAALAQEYTKIERVVIVREDTDRIFVGLATPIAIRRVLGTRFPELERVFAQILSNVQQLGSFTQQVVGFGAQWSHHSFGQPQHVTESSFRQLISHGTLIDWLSADLETLSFQWNGTVVDKQLYASVLRADQPYVPLLQGRRLAKVVHRHEFAERVAIQAVA